MIRQVASVELDARRRVMSRETRGPAASASVVRNKSVRTMTKVRTFVPRTQADLTTSALRTRVFDIGLGPGRAKSERGRRRRRGERLRAEAERVERFDEHALRAANRADRLQPAVAD